jgi:endonuclease/exonuclease/phosphatase (EEP) superfamily protein YafD
MSHPPPLLDDPAKSAERDRTARADVRYTLLVGAYVTLAFLGLASAATLLGRVSVFELATHFRPHYAVAAFASAVLLAVLRSRWGLAVAVVLTAFNGTPVIAYLLAEPPAREVPPETISVRLMSININYGNHCHSCVREAIRKADPDVVVLLEVTPTLWRDLEARGEYPHRAARPGLGGGIGIMSRHPLGDPKILDLDDSGQSALATTLYVAGTPVWLLAMHPPPPVNRTWAWYRDRQLASAAALARAAPEARIVVGDLNVTPWSPYYKALLRDAGLRDARVGYGLWPTWPTRLPASLGIPIDHCFVGDGVAVSGFHTGATTGSDHRPIVIDLSVNGPE